MSVRTTKSNKDPWLHQEEGVTKYLRQQKPDKEEEQEQEPLADCEKSNQWLDNAWPKVTTERLIMTAQEPVLSTRLIEVGVYHTR